MAFKKLVLIDDCDKALEKIKAFHANHHDPYSKKLLHAWSVIMDMVLRDDYGARDMYDALSMLSCTYGEVNAYMNVLQTMKQCAPQPAVEEIYGDACGEGFYSQLRGLLDASDSAAIKMADDYFSRFGSCIDLGPRD